MWRIFYYEKTRKLVEHSLKTLVHHACKTQNLADVCLAIFYYSNYTLQRDVAASPIFISFGLFSSMQCNQPLCAISRLPAQHPHYF